MLLSSNTYAWASTTVRTSFYLKMLTVTNFAQSCKIQALSLMHWCTTFAGVGVGETVLLNQARQHQLMSEYIDSLFLRLTVKNSILICLFETVTLWGQHIQSLENRCFLLCSFVLLMYILFFQFLAWFAYVLHPGKLTWNLRFTCLKRKIIFQTFTFGVHVNFQGCKVFLTFTCY